MSAMPNVQTGTAAQLVERFAHAEARSMIRWFCDKTRYFFNPEVRLDLSPNRNVSRGGIRKSGEAFISMALHKYTESAETRKPYFYEEYASFHRSATIGGFTGHWAKAVSAMVAHELAHAIQYYYKDDPRLRQILGITARYDSIHGEYFRQLYRIFREQFVNYREFDFEYVVIATPVKAKVKTQPKVKRAVKGVRMELSKTTGGWFIHKYFDESGKLLGTMASKPRYASQGLINGKWETLKDPQTGSCFKNHNAAKKFFIGK